jgi:serine/threonine protein kinase
MGSSYDDIRKPEDVTMNAETLTAETPGWGHGVSFLLRAGQLLAERFRIIGSLGAGAMGQVYEAEDLELGERIALKVASTDPMAPPGSEARFSREIRLARRITHPNVCRVFDLVDTNRGPLRLRFYTMELLDGATLESRCKQVIRFSPDEVAPLLRQMAEGLEAAHAADVVHRDLKPANIMLVPDGRGGTRVVLTDFGLAASTRGDLQRITLSLVGTPMYMAPEQVNPGQPITRATDLYALGVITFEMLTGQPPFVGDSWYETARMRLMSPPPSPRALVPDLDPRWETLVLRCMAQNPAERFASARELRDAIPPVEPVPTDGPPRPALRALRPEERDSFRGRSPAENDSEQRQSA